MYKISHRLCREIGILGVEPKYGCLEQTDSSNCPQTGHTCGPLSLAPPIRRAFFGGTVVVVETVEFCGGSAVAAVEMLALFWHFSF